MRQNTIEYWTWDPIWISKHLEYLNSENGVKNTFIARIFESLQKKNSTCTDAGLYSDQN